MGLKRLGNRYITLQHIQISWPKELNRIYGSLYQKSGIINVHRQELKFKCKYYTYDIDIEM